MIKNIFLMIAACLLMLGCQSQTDKARDRAGAAWALADEKFANVEGNEGIELHRMHLQRLQQQITRPGDLPTSPTASVVAPQGPPAATIAIANISNSRCLIKVANVGVEREVYVFTIESRQTLVLPDDLPGVLPLEPNGRYHILAQYEGRGPTSTQRISLSPYPTKVFKVGLKEAILCNGYATIGDAPF
jgi:hypothetical protein